jgi:hypothetical protein
MGEHFFTLGIALVVLAVVYLGYAVYVGYQQAQATINEARKELEDDEVDRGTDAGDG